MKFITARISSKNFLFSAQEIEIISKAWIYMYEFTSKTS